MTYTLIDDLIYLELNGEILALVVEFSTNCGFAGFHLFRADLSRNMWVKMEEGIGDGALFVADRSTFSLLAADVGNNKNCIYFSRGYVEFSTKGHPR